MGFVTLLKEYGWIICLMSFIGCVLVGIIKTPINKAIKAKLEASNADESTKKRTNTIYDSLVYIGNFVIAVIITLVYEIIKGFDLSFAAFFEMSIQTWLLQNAFYGIWKKLGAKKLLITILTAVKNQLVNLLDKNENNKIEADEFLGTIKEIFTNRKKAKEAARKVAEGAIVETADMIAQAAPEETNINEAEKKAELHGKVVDLASAVKENTGLKF